MKALGMSAAESVFSSIGQGQIGAVYRDIIRKEGVEVGQKVFKDGLIEMYKGALKKYGVPVGLMGEGIEESATQITQNMISGKPAFEGAADAFILGGGSGVMFTAPMSLKNANDRINNKLKEVEDKKQINLILDGSTDGLNKVFDVAKDSEINEKQLSIASLDKSRDLLVKELDRGVKKGEITKEQAKQSLYVFDKTKQITGQLRGVDIDEKSKVTVANLLKERESLSQKIQGKDEALSVLEKQRINEINEEIKQTILKSKEDAVQEQTTDESVLRTEQPEVELQGVGEGNAQGETIINAQSQEVVGIPDEISQPIDLTVPNTVITQPEEVKGTFLENVLDKIYEYTDPITGDKLKGNIFFDGQEVVFTDSNKEFSLGTVQDILSNNSLNATEVTPTFNINEDGTIDILQETDGIPKGKITPQGAGLKAIKTDKDGNVKRVVITDVNGVTHSIKGELANDLAEVMMFDLAKQGGLTKKINNDETARETFNRGVREANAKRKGKNTKKSVQGLDRGGRVEEAPTPETVAEVKPQEIEVITETAPVETTTEAAPVVEGPKTELTIDEQMAQHYEDYNNYQDEISKVEKDNSLTEEQKDSKINELEDKARQSLKKGNALGFEKARTKPTEAKAKVAPTETKADVAPVVEKQVKEEAPKQIAKSYADVKMDDNGMQNKQLRFSFKSKDGNIYDVVIIADYKGYPTYRSIIYKDGVDMVDDRDKFWGTDKDKGLNKEALEYYEKLRQTKTEEQAIEEILVKVRFKEREAKSELLYAEKNNQKTDYQLKRLKETQEKIQELEKELEEAKAKTQVAPETKAEVATVEEAKTEMAAAEKAKSEAETGADLLDSMTEDERDTFIDDWYEDRIPRTDLPGGNKAILLYEARKIAPKQEGKIKRVTIDNSFYLSNEAGFVIRVDGEVYGLTKYENPDATTDKEDSYGDPKDFVWAYTDLKTGETTETFESDVDGLVEEIRSKNKPTETAEVDKIKSDIEASKDRMKKAWDKYKNMGIAFDPKNNLARDIELVNSLIEYAYNNIRLGSYNASKFIKDLAEQGFEITKDGAKFIIDKATQKIATEEAKAEIKDLKGQVVDVFKAAIDAIKIVQATAKEKAKNIKEISQQLIKDIKELESTGKITPTQAINMISKFNKVNMLNEVSVSNFIDYMTKVFADADYDNKIKVAKGKLKAAKKNINTKIGIANGLAYPLQTLFSINPSLIPIKNLERYMELVDMFSARKSVLQLDEISQVINDVNEILDEINTEQSLVEELSYRLNYSNNQVIEDGKLNYADTVKNMVKEGDITEEEAALMTKYKSEIVPKLEQTDEEKQKKKEELEEEKKELENELKKSTINASDLPTRDERNVAKRLAEYLRKPFIKQLNNVDLKNLLKAIDNINNGYLPHQAELILEKLDGFVDGKTIDNSIEKANLKKISQLVNTVYNSIKSKMTGRDTIFEMIRRSPLFNIDQVLGNFKTEDLYYALLGKSAKAEAKFSFELKTIQEKLQKAQNKVAKSEGYFKSMNPLKAKISSYKIKTYQLQLEHDSNPGDKRVNQASEYIKATIKHINKLKSQYNENDVKILEDILKEFAPDGNIDIDKLYNSFNSAEKEAIKTLQEVKKFESEKAEFTASVIRGKRINPLNNHTHISVLGDNSKEDLDVGASFANDYNNSLNPSTKAKNLMERTPGVKPINFDAYSTALRSAKYVLMDYYLTAPVRTARKAIKAAEVALEKDGDMSKEQQRIFNSVEEAFKLAVSDLINNSYVQTSTGQDIINSISKQGYRAVLAGLGKSSIELLSNLGFVVFDPFTFYKGAEHMGILLSEDGPAIMNNSKSIQTPRVYAAGLSGRMIDLGILDQSVGTKSSKTRGKIINKAQQIWNLTGKKFIKNPVELTADALISSPDKIIMRPYWLGSYITELEKQLGRKVTKEDLKKIAENNEQYMNENEAAIEAATRVADRKSKLMGATKNGFAGLLRGKTRAEDNAGVAIVKNFNAFMTNFMVYEFSAAKTGVMAAIGDGTMTRSEGASVLAGVITRMTVYNLLIKATTSGVAGLLGLGFGLDDDDEEEEKTVDQLVTQSLTSTFATLALGRDFGNVSKTVINYGFEEYVTKEYLEGLRTGKYDPYEDAILINSLQRDEKTGEMETWENIPNFMGSYGPIAKTGALAVKVISSKDKKKADAIERQQKERNIRLPLEILGNSGYVPLYKEIRKSVMDDIYKDLRDSGTKKVMTREEYYKLFK